MARYVEHYDGAPESILLQHLARITHTRSDLKPGWYEEGSMPATIKAAQTARLLVKRLSEKDLENPFIAPDPEGGYEFEFRKYIPEDGEPNQEGFLSILPDGTFKFQTFPTPEPARR